MFPINLSKTLSFKRCIGDGDLVIVYERHDNMKAVKVSEGSILQNRFGVFKHSEWIGKPFGSKAFSNKGGSISDSNCPSNFERTGLNNLVTVDVRDIQGEEFPDKFCGAVDSVFLDLPQPWLAIPSAAKMLRQDGVLCSFSPCIEQVQRSSETLRSSFTDIRTFEVLLRTYEVREGKAEGFNGDDGSPEPLPRKRRQRSSDASIVENVSAATQVMVRPSSEARGHTGYLTVARLKCFS